MSETVDPKTPEREAAEILKLQLEARKLEADIEAVRIENEERQAKARKAVADALIAEHDAAVREIRRAESERLERLTLLSDFYQNHYLFEGQVNQKTVSSALNTLHAWHRRDDTSDWNITVDSPGGSITDGMHLFDTIVGYSRRGGGTHKITMTVRGMAASMGGIILQAADERVIGPNATILVHQLSAGAMGSLGELKDQMKRFDLLTEQIIQVFLDRAEGKIDRETFVNGWERTDWWLSAREAVNLGMADRIG